LLQFQVPHTIVIPGLEANCCDRLICRYIREVYQSRGADRAIDLRIRENRRHPSYCQYHNCAGSKYGVTLVAACSTSQVFIMRFVVTFDPIHLFFLPIRKPM
jgi:hypothetical protein